MSVVQIRKAQREGARLLIVLAGYTGSGKTLSAILLGYGLAGYNAAKLGFLDTENRRGSLHADVLLSAEPPTSEPFLIGDLSAPFSPQRYADAIKQFQAAGVEVLIVDSGSHEWEGVGGCQDIAGDDNKYWNRAKNQHKKHFMSALLQTDMHIIVCVRAHEKVKIIDKKESSDGKTKYESLGLQPIQEKSFMFDATASLMMHNEGTQQIGIKIPGALRLILGRGNDYLTPKDGKAIRDWVDGAKKLDPKVESFRNRLLSNTEGGLAHIEDCWSKVPKFYQDALTEEFHETLKQSAKEFDLQKAEATQGEDLPQVDGDATKAAIAATAKAGASTAAQTQKPLVTPQSAPVTQPKSAPATQARPATPVNTTAAATTTVSATPAKAAPVTAQRAATHRPATPATTNRAPVTPAKTQTPITPTTTAKPTEQPPPAQPDNEAPLF